MYVPNKNICLPGYYFFFLGVLHTITCARRCQYDGHPIRHDFLSYFFSHLSYRFNSGKCTRYRRRKRADLINHRRLKRTIRTLMVVLYHDGAFTLE